MGKARLGKSFTFANAGCLNNGTLSRTNVKSGGEEPRHCRRRVTAVDRDGGWINSRDDWRDVRLAGLRGSSFHFEKRLDSANTYSAKTCEDGGTDGSWIHRVVLMVVMVLKRRLV